MFGTKINRTSVRSYQSVEASRNPRVSTKATEDVKKVVSKKISEKKAVSQIVNAVCIMLDSRKFSGYSIDKCATIAVNAYRNC